MNDLIKCKAGKTSSHQSNGLKFRIVVILLLMATFGMTQNVTVRGKVTEAENGESIPGVSVVLKGTTTGIPTDINGNYTLSVPSDGTLVFSYIGFKKVEVPIDGKTDINVALVAVSISLEEFVAVGYGNQRRKDLTGAVSSVSGAELRKTPITSTAQAMTGKIAGIQVTTTDGSPDAAGAIPSRP